MSTTLAVVLACRIFLGQETDPFEARVVGGMLTTLEHDVRAQGFDATLNAECREDGVAFYFDGTYLGGDPEADARMLCAYVTGEWGYYKCVPMCGECA